MNKAEWEDLIALTQAERSAAWSRIFASDPEKRGEAIREWSALGNKIADLKASFRKRFPDDGAEPGPPPPREIAEEKVRKWLLDRRQQHDPKKPYPSREADQRAAEAELGGKIARDIFRRLRKEIIGPELLPKRGRHRAATSTQPAPSSAPRRPYRRK